MSTTDMPATCGTSTAGRVPLLFVRLFASDEAHR
jgi:hypothetical protein